MTTWEDVALHIREQYTLRRDQPNFLVASLTVTGAEIGLPAARDTVQLVHVQTVVEFGEPWLLLRATLCNQRAIEVPAVLRLAARQVLGALVLSDHVLALRHGMPMATLRREDVDRTLLFLARSAVHVRLSLGLRLEEEGEPAQVPPPPPAADAPPVKAAYLPWTD